MCLNTNMLYFASPLDELLHIDGHRGLNLYEYIVYRMCELNPVSVKQRS